VNGNACPMNHEKHERHEKGSMTSCFSFLSWFFVFLQLKGPRNWDRHCNGLLAKKDGGESRAWRPVLREIAQAEAVNIPVGKQWAITEKTDLLAF
jgi:hypothetical protein